MTAEDSLFDAPGAFQVVLEQLGIVIGFQDQHLGRFHPLQNQPGGMAKVSQEPDIHPGRPQEKSDWIVSVMRNAECIHADIADFEGGTGGEDSAGERRFKLPFQRFTSQAIAINRDLEFDGELRQALDMIRVLMSEKDSLKSFRGAAKESHSLPDLPPAETGINEKTGLAGFKEGAVAVGAAPKDRKAYSHRDERYLDRNGQSNSKSR
jgi:hypothetical protein